MREEKFKPIEKLFVEYFEQEANKINADFGETNCRFYAHFPLDNDPQFGYFSMYMDCILKKGDYEGADNVSLGILAYDHTDKFTINAEICWGDPSGKIEATVFEEPVEVTEQSLAAIKKRLPDLVFKLRELIRENSNGI